MGVGLSGLRGPPVQVRVVLVRNSEPGSVRTLYPSLGVRCVVGSRSKNSRVIPKHCVQVHFVNIKFIISLIRANEIREYNIDLSPTQGVLILFNILICDITCQNQAFVAEISY